MNSSLYFDYAAATPMDPRVLAAMQPYFSDNFYNPSSPYLAAKKVRTAIEEARARVAHWVGARPAEIIFTAGATESINVAIHGVMQQFPSGNLLVSEIEHDAVLGSAARYAHQKIPVEATGLVKFKELTQAINDHTVLISVGYANNELGTVQPLRHIAEIVAKVRIERQKKGNTLPLFFHTDASQAAAYLDLHTASLGVDLLTLNGGKIYGPKQTGMLYVRAGTLLKPLISGGGQENGMRSGTENVAGIIGFAAALDLVQQDRKEVVLLHRRLRDELQHRITTSLPQTVLNGDLKRRLPNNLHVSWPNLDGERLVMTLDEVGLMAATGSACAANKQTASHVLQAIGLEENLRQGSLRLSIGSGTTMASIEQAAKLIIQAVQKQYKLP